MEVLKQQKSEVLEYFLAFTNQIIRCISAQLEVEETPEGGHRVVIDPFFFSELGEITNGLLAASAQSGTVNDVLLSISEMVNWIIPPHFDSMVSAERDRFIMSKKWAINGYFNEFKSVFLTHVQYEPVVGDFIMDRFNGFDYCDVFRLFRLDQLPANVFRLDPLLP
jgi:hypothetical protein